MGEIIKIGSEKDRGFKQNVGPGYSDRRGISDIDFELKDTGSEYTFRDVVDTLFEIFPSEQLEVVEGGCGFAYILKDLQTMAQNQGVSVTTTGITKEVRHEEAASYLDRLLIGTLQEAQSKKVLPNSHYHLAIDIRGAAHYDREDTILPIYHDLLKIDGLLFIWIMQLNPQNGWMQLGGEKYAKTKESEMVELLKQNGFESIWRTSEYALLKKKGHNTSSPGV